jgi:UDP-N-acetylmuramoyl-tripeptide--D-alanyl-D-alanine ligase
MKLPLGRVAALMNAGGEFNREAIVQGYSIDSRTVGPGELFFAVRGERLDGHDFVADAMARGAAGAVIDKDHAHRFPERVHLLVVDDALPALQKVAAGVRRLWGKPLIAITGSAGKTTTKEITARLLSKRHRVLKSEGNLNNHFGLPLQLLRLESDHDLAVVELGMSHPGEIAALAALAQPTLGAVTNVAPVHLGFFRSVAEIARAKKELIDALPSSATAVLNADDEFVSQFGRDFSGRIVTYGVHNPADVRAECVDERGLMGSTFAIVVGNDQHRARLPLLGRHNIYNALAAVAVAIQYDIGAADAVRELAGLSAVDKRGQIVEIAGVTVINDCYNSNPRALDSMVDALAGTYPDLGGRRIVVAGEMLELGPAGAELHQRCGRHIAERGMEVLIGVRGSARYMVEAARQVPPKLNPSHAITAKFVDSPELAGEWLAREARPGDVVLLKASRGVRLERALEVWRSRIELAVVAAEKER